VYSNAAKNPQLPLKSAKKEVNGRKRTLSRIARLDLLTVVCQLNLEHREGIEPSNTGFADQRVSHFATGAHSAGLK
jgi:hypothetical protein